VFLKFEIRNPKFYFVLGMEPRISAFLLVKFEIRNPQFEILLYSTTQVSPLLMSFSRLPGPDLAMEAFI
jgi:hypothetical protein